MTKYEIVNPSDLCYIEGNDFKSVCIATMILGEGYYGLHEVDGESTMPPPIFATGWFEEQFGESFPSTTDDIDKSMLVTILRTVKLGGERTSLNDIERHAKAIVERLEAN